jgi:phage FluMu protein Com
VSDVDRPVRTWKDVRCCGCSRLLLKQTPFAVRAGESIEIKCARCNALNYIVGILVEQST